MKIKNNLIFIKNIFYKIYTSSILISFEKKNRLVSIFDVELKINDWVNLLDNITFPNLFVEQEKLVLKDNIIKYKNQKNLDVYQMWIFQNEINLLMNKGNWIWKK